MKNRNFTPLIWIVSVVVPLLVGLMLSPRFPQLDVGFDTSGLPRLNAFINSGVAILLVLGYVFVRKKNYRWHKRSMLGALLLSACFLISYVLYHISSGHTTYCDEGPVPAAVYFFVLISHIILSSVIIPLALFTINRALSERFDKHRRLARITLPLWLYVAVTGVLVYVMISPCY
ncbi:MAG: DUF420 domain-containing protein [Bacteroidetes bacterium]|nr:MAG: DUF420 domain-containing protein [Bacteroidota bacterium]